MNSYVAVLILVLVALLAWSVSKLGAAERVPEPTYQRLAVLPQGVEIRSYPALNIAKTSMKDASLGQSANEGFRRVAKYLFGGNRNREAMAMTAPVVMEMGNQPSLYFFMPFDRSLEALPATVDSNVRLQTQPARTLAVLRFGGFARNKVVQRKYRELQRVLAREGWTVRGPLLYMGYNAPWTLVGRRNEVALEVERPPLP
ncbi:MAG: SOUL family heme-binding protein [Bacteroidota bacterium]